MATRNVGVRDFRQVTQSGIVLLDWWAEWCGPCRVFVPQYEAASARHPDVTFGRIDTDAEPELADSFRITALPTLMAFRDGVLVFNQEGVVPGTLLDRLVAEVKALDMNDIRQSMPRPARAAPHPEVRRGRA